MRLAGWKTGAPLTATEDECFLAISALMLGEPAEQNLAETSLLSKAGWSVYLASVTDMDPIHIGK
jgi:hypothetical protein